MSLNLVAVEGKIFEPPRSKFSSGAKEECVKEICFFFGGGGGGGGRKRGNETFLITRIFEFTET